MICTRRPSRWTRSSRLAGGASAASAGGEPACKSSLARAMFSVDTAKGGPVPLPLGRFPNDGEQLDHAVTRGVAQQFGSKAAARNSPAGCVKGGKIGYHGRSGPFLLVRLHTEKTPLSIQWRSERASTPSLASALGRLPGKRKEFSHVQPSNRRSRFSIRPHGFHAGGIAGGHRHRRHSLVGLLLPAVNALPGDPAAAPSAKTISRTSCWPWWRTNREPIATAGAWAAMPSPALPATTSWAPRGRPPAPFLAILPQFEDSNPLYSDFVPFANGAVYPP